MRYPSDLLFIESKVLDIRQLFYCTIIMKFHQTKDRTAIHLHQYNTRNKNTYIVPQVTKTISQRAYAYLAPKLYNSIPDNIKNIASLSLFKKKNKLYITDTKN